MLLCTCIYFVYVKYKLEVDQKKNTFYEELVTKKGLYRKRSDMLNILLLTLEEVTHSQVNGRVIKQDGS